ncbi:MULTISPECIES: pyridoxamine 5'-phosphate oxidase family protein [unclassified Streptomyces]|uniref:pyridoxamine 5'-phosphate oxidase family protein n=1 Tax=unclassified Streptomyces TaxID=2593676 RepID=UPI002DDB51AB|nr:pyridoxamine 5'-phosphate oxidase family protein [Streptomyces sp. NBC_01558]WSD76257.1 pyridoxamine 5'-phosphate oxidase family protein [Streptomyces sp. NBC_01558]
MNAPARTPKQRKQDTLARLESDVDTWVSTADGTGGTPYLVPLSYLWDGTTLLLATLAGSPTGLNLRSSGTVRLGIGPTRDVVMIDGTVETLEAGELPDGVGDAFAAGTGFDPRELTAHYRYFRVTPQRVQAWREANEIAGRDLMRDGEWLVAD